MGEGEVSGQQKMLYMYFIAFLAELGHLLIQDKYKIDKDKRQE